MQQQHPPPKFFHQINGKWHCDNTRLATITSKNSPQLKTVHSKCHIAPFMCEGLEGLYHFIVEELNHYSLLLCSEAQGGTQIKGWGKD